MLASIFVLSPPKRLVDDISKKFDPGSMFSLSTKAVKLAGISEFDGSGPTVLTAKAAPRSACAVCVWACAVVAAVCAARSGVGAEFG